MRRARLDIHLQKQNLDDEVDRGAVARVIPIDSKSPEQQVVIPAGKGKKFTSVNVKPGKYLVETRLPSGQLVRQSVDVKADKETQKVSLQGAPSSHEWMSWQTLAAPSRPASSAPAKGKVSVSVFAVDRVRSDSWNRLATLVRTRTMPTVKMVQQALGAGAPTVVAPAERDDRVARYVWNDSQHGAETIAVITRPRTIEIVALPVPWRTNRGRIAPVECVVPTNPEAPLGLAVRDPDLGAIVGNLAAGSLDDARLLLGEDASLELLDAKRENQFGATLGACVLTKSDTSGKRQSWDTWIDNLASWFPWLPDGAALQSVRRLRLARKPADLKGVHASVVETLRRGIPIFAPVATMFLDTLATLVEDPSFESSDLKDHAAAVRAVMLRMQSGHAFTVLRFEAKGKTKK